MSRIEVPIFKQSYCDELLDKATLIPSIYGTSGSYPESSEFAEHYADGASSIHINIEALSELDLSRGYKEPGVNMVDVKNSIILFSKVLSIDKDSHKFLTPLEASDKRLWTYLAHSHLYEYVKHRWKDGEIARRFFIPGTKSQLNPVNLVRHGVARLWWMAFVTYDPLNKNDPFHLLPVLNFSTDGYQSILERSFALDRKLLKAYLLTLKENEELQNQGRNREVLKRVVADGAIMDLGVLEIPELMTYFENQLSEIPKG